MSEPEHTAMHDYAYHPSVANWVQSTSLATALDGTQHDEPQESPDDYYRYTNSHADHAHVDQMTSTRQRQMSNGAVGTPRPPFRAGGIAPLHPAARSSPQLPVNTSRPTVKSLAQKFNQPTSNDSSPASSTRARTVRPSPPQRSTSDSLAIAPSAAPRPRETSYGSHKFTNLKPRERPQPAPSASPASSRKTTTTNGERKPAEDPTSPRSRRPTAGSRKHSQASIASVTSSTGDRRPFFGEVIGEYDATTPGFGIPVLDPVHDELEPPQTPTSRIEDDAASKAMTIDSHLSPRSFRSVQSPNDSHFSPQSSHHPNPKSPPIRHKRTPSQQTQKEASPAEPHVEKARRRSPTSRIPVSTRRLSTASDSSSSNRSYRASSARPPGGFKSPVRQQKEGLPTIESKTTLPATSFKEFTERGKSPKASNAGKSLAAVITTASKPQPPSPRLRNSRERQLLSQPGSPNATPRTSHENVAVNGQSDVLSAPPMLEAKSYFPETAEYAEPSRNEPTLLSPKRYEAPGKERPTRYASNPVQNHVMAALNGFPKNFSGQLARKPSIQKDSFSDMDSQESLSRLNTNLSAPELPPPLSSTTDFEESPVLGMPGGFTMTPPAQATPPLGSSEGNRATRPVASNQTAQDTSAPQTKEVSGGELLQPLTFQSLNMGNQHFNPTGTMMSEDFSELGIRESIPIMLGGEQTSPTESRHSPRQSMSSRRWRTEPLDSSGTISYIEEEEYEDSPIDSFPNRQTLGPDDSASVAFFNRPEWKEPPMPSMPDKGILTLNSEAYSVINKVLNLYAKSPKITPEVAHESRQKMQKVSPVLAQHTDWGSKESTETYLARLLSDANGAEHMQPSADDGGASAEQRVQHDANSHAVPSLNYHPLDESPIEPQDGGTAIIFPTESRRYSRESHSSVATTIHDDGSRPDSFSGFNARDRSPEPAAIAPLRLQPTTFVPQPKPRSRLQPAFSPQLPEIRSAGEGLGIGPPEQPSQPSQQSRQQSKPPPPPACAPPPPPSGHGAAASLASPGSAAKVPYTPSVDAPAPLAFSTSRSKAAMCLTPGAPFPYNHGYAMHVDGTGASQDTLVAPREDYRPEPQLTRPSETTLVESVSGSNAPSVHSQTDGAGDSRDSASGPAPIEHRAAFPGEDEAAIDKRLKRRFRILQELHMTEGGYMSDLMVVTQIWMATSVKAEVFSNEERATVFCNIDELEALSAQMAIDLKKACEPIRTFREGPETENDDEETDDEDLFDNVNLDNDDKTSVGYVMKQYLPMIEDLYTKYILNHDKANKIIVQRGKAQDGTFVGWQYACHDHSKDITDAWDLDSLLVKPVQRLMKYPLMLQTLKDCTPPTHDDYKDIDLALKGVIDISVRINEKKKRIETVRQATKEGKKGKKKGFPGIDIVRAFGAKDKITKAVATENFVDPEYDANSQKFGGHFFQIQILINDFTKYREELTTSFVHLNLIALNIVALLEDQQSSTPEIESQWRHNAMALLELRNVLLEDHKKAVMDKVLEPLQKLWAMYVRPQKLMDQRKKGLIVYTRYKQALERKEKIDPKQEDHAQQFLAVNDALKEELPKLYALSKKCVQMIFRGFLHYQKNWWKNCQKKMLPLLETEPEHTTSFTADMQDYVNHFKSDLASVQAVVDRLKICNGALMFDVASLQSPTASSIYGDDASSRKSTSRRTESMGSDMSIMNSHVPAHRRSAGYNPSQRTIPSFEGPPRSAPHNGMPTAYQPAATQSAGDYAWELPYQGNSAASQHSSRSSTNHGVPSIAPRDERAISPSSERSDSTLTKTHSSSNGRSSIIPFPPLDSMFDPAPPQEASASASHHSSQHLPAPNRSPSYSTSTSSRGSAVFQSALPMGGNQSAEELPGTPADPEEPEVLFLAASLFEFNIAHDRREGGIPYLVYVPGEIFDVIGMKGELWLARNQDDPNRTVGWIWEKHFARILPEET